MTTSHDDETRLAATVEIEGRDLTEQQRADVQRSIEAMAMHSVEVRDRARAAQAEATKLSDTINRPLHALMERDAATVAEFEALLKESSSLNVDDDLLRYPDSVTGRIKDTLPQVTVSDAGLEGNLTRTADSDVFHGPPYHYAWAWHRADGSPPSRVQTDRPTGQVGLKGAAGPLAPGSGDRFVEVHAGFGLVFIPPANGLFVGESARRFLKIIYIVAAYGVGSSAITEGGTECTLLEGNQLKGIETRRLWRKRVSFNEREDYESNLFGDGPMRLQHPVRAGVACTFNIGMWLYVDNASGAGRSGAGAALRGEIPIMRLIGPQ